MELAAMVKVGELVMYGEGRKSRLHTAARADSGSDLRPAINLAQSPGP